MVERVIRLEARHYEIQGKDRRTDIGQAVDAARKEEVVELGAARSERFDPHDYFLDGYYHEIKSSEGDWLSIPLSEVEFARSEIAAGRDVVYDVFQQVDLQHARFLGQVAFGDFQHLLEPSKFMKPRKTPEGWIEERSLRVPLRKVKPLLT